MIPGETILSGAPQLPGVSEFQVMHSGAGYYIGTMLEGEGPYTRETGYFRTRGEAEAALARFRETGVLEKQRLP